MNKYEHSEQSAKIFGGKSHEYEELHALIDSNKTVTPSIFGRFFLHHTDIGQPILEKVFGKVLGKKKVPVRKLLIQHLLEDYNSVKSFEFYWLPALKENQAQLPKLDDWGSVLEKAKRDPRLKTLQINQLKELDDFFRLKTILEKSAIIKDDLVFAIFGHALGGDLAAKIIGQKFHGLWASDVVTGFLSCRFKWADRNRDPVPTLLDYEKYVPDQDWMHAPEDYTDTDRLDSKRIKEKIDRYEHNIAVALSVATRVNVFSPHRNPCNLD